MPVRKTPKKWIKTKADEQAIREGCYFDLEEANFVIDFIETFCCLSQGKWAGLPIKLIPWQVELIRQLYGWRRKDGTRRFRTAYVEIPKKNGKSGLVSALALYHLVADGEQGAYVCINAVDREQASTVFDESMNMVTASKHLARILTPIPSKKTITHPASKSKMVANSAEVDSKDGKNASLVVFDELHRQRTDAMWNVWKYAGIAREQPLRLVITTAGHDRESICFRQHEYTTKVLSGEIEEISHYGCIYAADPGDDIEDPKTWYKANPSLGITIREEDFRRELEEVLGSPNELNLFLRLRFNLWTQAESRYIERAKWDACRGEHGYRELPDKLQGMRCWGGADLSSTDDLTAFVLLFEGGEVLAHFWLPRNNIVRKEKKDGVKYQDWAAQGILTLTEGDRVDYDVVRDEIVAMCNRYDVEKVAIDPHNANHICTQLINAGIKMEFFRQGFISMNAPVKELERLISRGEIIHGGNPILTWMADNAVVTRDSSLNLKIDKLKARQKVDGIVSLAEAVEMRMSAIGSEAGGTINFIDL